MPPAPAAALPVHRRPKAALVAGNGVLAVLAVLMAIVTFTQVEAAARWVLAVPPLVGAMGFAAVAVGRLSQPLPVVGPGTIRGRAGLGVRSRGAEQLHDISIDVALAGMCLALIVLDSSTGGWWRPYSWLLIPFAGWFLVRAGLALTGRRNVQSVWIVAGEIVHEAWWGVERTPLANVQSCAAVDDLVLLRLRAPAHRQVVPGPWRGRRPPGPRSVVIDTSGFGHRAGDVAEWIAHHLPDR